MRVRFKGGNAVVVRRMRLDDSDGVVALVNSRIMADEAIGRERRLGPISRDTLLRSFEEFAGLSVLLAEEDSGAILGCALVAVFEQLEGPAVEADDTAAEAAKLTVADHLLGTKAAALLHALRIVGIERDRRVGGVGLTLYYNVLSGNARQLEYMKDLALEEVSPTGYVGAVLAVRRANLDLGEQRIRSFVPTTETLKQALKVLLEAAADRLLSRPQRDDRDIALQAWALVFEHPLLTDELATVMTMSKELGIAVPKQLERRLASAGPGHDPLTNLL